jgi:NDP-sugar pyrophosphorylase family protein
MSGAATYSIVQGGIIAAGLGSRLRAEGYCVSKPMVQVAGRPLIEHALERFRAAGIRRLTIVINDEGDDCQRWLDGHREDLDLDLIVRTTPSSYASFQLVADRLDRAPSVITTIDSILPIEDFCAYVMAAASFPRDAVVLGVTDYVDDENPLWATVDAADGRIRQLGREGGSHVTAGLYMLPAHRPAKPSAGFPRLRDYLTWLVAENWPVYGFVLPRVFDIDRGRDIVAAESMVLSHQRRDTGP